MTTIAHSFFESVFTSVRKDTASGCKHLLTAVLERQWFRQYRVHNIDFRGPLGWESNRLMLVRSNIGVFVTEATAIRFSHKRGGSTGLLGHGL